MSDQSGQTPFKNLGQRLKLIRQKLHESAADVSGAVEIDVTTLERFEAGQERPSEDILQLLIIHFGVQDDDADKLWRLAGYEKPTTEDDIAQNDDIAGRGPGLLVMAFDPRVIYSDSLHVNATPSGVVLSFGQSSIPQQHLTTARVGMSREQARNVIRILQGALDRSEQRQLPAPSMQPDSTEESSDDSRTQIPKNNPSS